LLNHIRIAVDLRDFVQPLFVLASSHASMVSTRACCSS
jgi:hypothetical protein